MSVTKAIPREELQRYFAEFTRRFLTDGSPEAVDADVVEPELGSQVPLQGARLLGITYDRKANALEFEPDAGDHRIFEPQEVWAIEEQDGFQCRSRGSPEWESRGGQRTAGGFRRLH